jgi:hypothetical protein
VKDRFMIAWMTCLGVLLVQDGFTQEDLHHLIDELKSDRVEARDAAAHKLLDAGDTARKSLEELTRSGDLETSTRAREILRRIDTRRLVRGRKVLVSFYSFPVGSREKASDKTKAHDKVAREIQDALAKAEINIIQVVRDSRQSERPHENPKLGGLHFDQLLLVDIQNRDPETTLSGLPYRQGAIVFDDGAYTRGFPIPGLKGNGVPARYAFMAWGTTESGLKEADLARYRGLQGVAVQDLPWTGRTEDGGSATLIPEPGTTLLEVFLLTRAKFRYVTQE